MGGTSSKIIPNKEKSSLNNINKIDIKQNIRNNKKKLFENKSIKDFTDVKAVRFSDDLD